MKRFFICLMATAMLVACGNKETKNSEEMTAAPEGAQSEMVTDDGADQGDWQKQTTLMGSKPMVVDFFATWCGPCKELAPILEKIEQNHKGEVIFRRIDVDQEPEMAMEFRIEAVPTLMFVTPTGDYQMLLGLQEPAVIEEKIAQLLKRSAK